MSTVAEKNSGSISRNKLLWVAGLGWLFDAMDVGILSFVIAALHEDWGLTSSQMGWIGSVNSIGMAVGHSSSASMQTGLAGRRYSSSPCCCFP